MLIAQEALGKTQEELLKAQEEASSVCKGLEMGLTNQYADVEGLLKELGLFSIGFKKLKVRGRDKKENWIVKTSETLH